MAAAAATATTTAHSASSRSSLVARRLYRNLLRASEPFTSPSPNAAVLTCLLHRTGIDDHIRDWDTFVTRDDKGGNAPPRNRTHQRLFRRLLREVVTGPDGYGKMVFPSQANTQRLRAVIQREFRANSEFNSQSQSQSQSQSHSECNSECTAASRHFDLSTRKQVAFAALRELNKKLSYHDWLASNSPDPLLPQQAACFVSALPTNRPSSYLRPGVFLVSHPFMQDSYFSRAVICILEHKGLGADDTSENTTTTTNNNNNDDESENDNDNGNDENDARRRAMRASSSTTPPGQTYGVLVNRIAVHPETGSNRTLGEVFREHMLPERMANVFGDSVVREGGPVHVALQVIHSGPSDNDNDNDNPVGGTVLPPIDSDADTDTDTDTDDANRDRRDLYSDKATYFKGNMFKMMSLIEEGKMNREDVSFFVGASIWSPGQLAAEIAQGYWIPCRGPPEMALDGICEHEPPQQPPPIIPGASASANTTTNMEENKNKHKHKHKRPLADLWLSMMSACGTDEAKLSHLFHRDHWDENGMPCDAFDDDHDDIVVF